MQRSAIALTILILMQPAPVMAQGDIDGDSESRTSGEADPVRPEDSLPAIVARTFEVRSLRRSSSMRVYQFEDTSGEQTKPGKILLLKQDGSTKMAFRVLKTYYPDKNEFAARRVKSYGENRILDLQQSFLAIEKLRDLEPYLPTPEERRQDDEDIRELEQTSSDPKPEPPPNPLPSTMAFDPELDSGTSPLPGRIAEEEPEFDDSAARLEALEVDDLKEFDPEWQWLTLSFGYLRNFKIDKESGEVYDGLFEGATLRYGVTLSKGLFINHKLGQDSVVVEGGASLYKTLRFTPGKSDAYTLMPLHASLRYNVYFSESFGIFGFGGIMKNLVISQSQEESDSLALLNSTVPAFGAGLLFQIGPKWFLRLDMGFDTVAGGLVLRF